MSVLVAYATAHGSTREIAERVAHRLGQQVAPAKVTCLPVDAVPTLSKAPNQYRAVVIGSAIHAGRWIGSGRRFLETNATFLSGISTTTERKDVARAPTPVWAFTVGMPVTDEDLAKEEQMVEDKILRRHLNGDAFRGHKLFRGVFDKEDLNWFLKLIFSHVIPEEKTKFGDHRDWDSIESWADGVGKVMREAGVNAEPTEVANSDGTTEATS